MTRFLNSRATSLISLEIPIEFTNRDSRFEYLDADVHRVRVQQSGPGALLKSIQPGQLKARVDLSRGEIGQNVFPIEKDAVNLPPGVVLRRIVPSSLEATIDTVATKELAVQADWAGSLSEGMTIESVAVVPDRVTVSGESLLLDKLSTVYTEKIQVDQIKESGRIFVKLALLPVLAGSDLTGLMKRYSDRSLAVVCEKEFSVTVDPPKALFSAWYEFFPRSYGGDPGRHGTFKECEKLIPQIAEMGFDVLYLPPLMKNNRRKLELMNFLLLSLPGTPIIYYGDKSAWATTIIWATATGFECHAQAV